MLIAKAEKRRGEMKNDFSGIPMKIVFMGTPDFRSRLQALAAGMRWSAVYTQPPRPAGRGKQDRPSPVQQTAEVAGPARAAPVACAIARGAGRFAALGADVAVVVAYGSDPAASRCWTRRGLGA
jgi:methionyl-tRNA formyltransferase